jgi:hypothetical protein
MNKSFRICLSNIKSAQKLILGNRRLDYTPLNQTLTAQYSKVTKDILRNRYPHRNKDGSFKEYNEAITILPKEYEDQGL